MKALAIAAFVLALAAGTVYGQTYVLGEISTNTTWEVAGSPFIVQGAIEVTDNSVLTIDAGVTVKFDGFYLLSTEAGSSIYAEGTQELRILFTSNSGTPAPDDWIWVGINSSPASYFAYCDFEYGRKGLDLTESDVTVLHCTFRNTNSYGLICENCSPTIEACDFYLNPTGIYVYERTAPTRPVIHGCNLHDNTYYNIYLAGFENSPLVTIDAEGNWWGTSVEAEIEDTIRHDVDNAAIYGHVDFDPWLYDVLVEATSWGKVKALFMR